MRPLARGHGLCDIDSLLSRKFQKNIFKNGKFWDTDYKPDCKTRILVLFRHDFPYIFLDYRYRNRRVPFLCCISYAYYILFYIQNRPKALITKTGALSKHGAEGTSAVSLVDDEKENLFNIDRGRIDEIIKKSKEEGYKKASERKNKMNKGEDEFKKTKQRVIKKMGLSDRTEYIQHFLNSEVDWPLLLTSLSNSEKVEIKCTFPKCVETAPMKPGALNGHCKAYHNWGTFKCDQCDFITYRESGLKTHKVKHSTRKTTVTDFHCEKCDMYYKNRQTLLWHNSATHRKDADTEKATWKKKQKCDKLKKCIFCPFLHSGFNGSRPMENHYQKHFDIKQHECEICGAKFGNRYNLNQHLNQHDSIYYRCVICQGSEIRGLRNTWTDGRCSFTGFIADNKDGMRVHFKKHHSEEGLKRMPSWKEIKKNVEEVKENDFTEDEKSRINGLRNDRENRIDELRSKETPIQRKSLEPDMKAICM